MRWPPCLTPPWRRFSRPRGDRGAPAPWLQLGLDGAPLPGAPGVIDVGDQIGVSVHRAAVCGVATAGRELDSACNAL